MSEESHVRSKLNNSNYLKTLFRERKMQSRAPLKRPSLTVTYVNIRIIVNLSDTWVFNKTKSCQNKICIATKFQAGLNLVEQKTQVEKIRIKTVSIPFKAK